MMSPLCDKIITTIGSANDIGKVLIDYLLITILLNFPSIHSNIPKIDKYVYDT